MKNIIIVFFLSMFLTACGSGGEKDDSDKTGGKDSGQGKQGTEPGETAQGSPTQTVTSPFSSKELTEANKIIGVYIGSADVDYSFYMPFGSFFSEEENQSVKVIINHSGDDDNKILITRVEKAGSPNEAFCTVWTGFGLSQGEEEIQNEGEENSRKISFTSFESKKKESFGVLGDVTYVESLRVLEQEGLGLKIKIHKDFSALSPEPIENLQKIDEQLSDFNTLLQACFSNVGSKDSGSNKERETSGELGENQENPGIVFSI